MKPRSVLVGGTTLLVRCAELLRSKGYQIEAVFSGDEAVTQWARDVGVVQLHGGQSMAQALSGRPFEYLFSIVNYSILDRTVLALPQRATINFHDGPLPRYAGLHATSWAILNEEKTHGITWHVVGDGVDAGPIVEQVAVEVRPSDTAFSLNARCYEAAVQGFSALLDHLDDANWRERTRPQDLSQRTLYRKHDRPPAAGFFLWDEPATRADALVRALDFGPIANPLGFARLWTGTGHVLVRQSRLLEGAPLRAPATIIEIDRQQISVATGVGSVSLSQLETVDGAPVEDVAAYFLAAGYTSGMRLPMLSEEDAQLLRRAHQDAARRETDWRNALLDAEPLVLATHAPPGESQLEETSFAGRSGFGTTEGRMAALSLAVYLARLSNQRELTLGWSSPSTAIDRFGLLAPRVPLKLALNPAASWAETMAAWNEQLETTLGQGSYVVDLAVRDPLLRTHGQVTLPVFFTHHEAEVRSGELAVVLEGDGIRLRFFPESLPPHWARALRSFQHFLAAADAASSVGSTPVVTPDELRLQLGTWNDTAAPFPRDRCIHQLVEEQVLRTPERTAVLDGEHSLTYRQLDDRATALARELHRAGVGRETRVGISVKRTVDMVVAVHAVLKAGAAYVPLDPNYPEARNAFIVKDAKVALLIGDSRLADRKFAQSLPRVEIDQLDLSTPGDTLPPVIVEPHQLAYVIYTSGSTGQPKGVAIEHRSAVAMIAWGLSEFTADELHRVLASTSLCFDMSVFEMFVPLSAGGTVVVVDDFLAWAEQQSPSVSLIDTVPSAIREYLRLRQKGAPAHESLRGINLGGEMLPQVLVEEIARIAPDVKIRDLWGPSESTTFSSVCWRRPGDVYSIGRPISNTRLYVLDDQLQPLPTGFPGEVYVAGEGLSRGYLDRPELTEQSFIADPFRPGERMYRTRDLCRYLDDGRIEYIRRIDGLVKLRGFRIELGEIESTLSKHAAVDQCVVQVRSDSAGHPTLVAYVVLKSPVSRDDLRQHAQATLPSYMIPLFVVLPEFPLNPNGKIDKKRLPEPSVERGGSTVEFEAPRDEFESKLAACFSEVLGLRQIGIHDSFMDLGGSSLQAFELQDKIASVLHAKMSIADVLTHPTVATLAPVLRVKHVEPAAPLVEESAPPHSFDELPAKIWMGPSQWPFWFGYHPDQFNVPLYLALTGPLDEGAVREVLDALIRQFPSLRYVPDRTVPVLRLTAPARVPLMVLDRSGAGEETRAGLAKELKSVMAEHAIDFKRSSASPQLQAFLCRLGPESAVLAVRYPHYLGDGYSNVLISRAIQTWLADGISIQPTAHFIEEIEAENRAYTREKVEGLRAFWSDFLDGAANVRVPQAWYVSSPVKERVVARFPAAPLEQTRRKHGILYRTLYGAALLHAFRKLAGSEDMFIRNFVLKRRRGVARESIYPRLYLEALPCGLPLDAPPAAILARTHERTTALERGQDVLVPLALTSLLSQTAGKSRYKTGAWASTVKGATSVYGLFSGANVDQRHLLEIATGDFLREPGQVDVYLNYIPRSGEPRATDDPADRLLSDLAGSYRRRCDGSFREFFGLDVIDSGDSHILSLDSPFTDEVDGQIISLVEQFLSSVRLTRA